MFSRPLRGLVVAALVLLAPSVPALGQSASKESEIKAAFVFNFIKFVEWPDEVFAGRRTPIKLCVWGQGALGGALDALRNKKTKNRAIQVLYTQEMRELSGCHVLFIKSTDGRSLGKIFGRMTRRPVLTISDMRGFATSGGIIGLFRSGEQMRFAINVDAARRSGLRISSQLLKLGKIVSTEER
jgi:hypothetical protein